jgi:uncharacterized protein
MKNTIPQRISASAALARGARYAGSLPLARLPRLADCAAGEGGEVQVDLTLERDAGRSPHLRGRIQATVPQQCQRCLRSFPQPLDVNLDLRLVFSEAEEVRLLRDCDPYLVLDDEVPLQQIVEDELLLALPMSPHCDRPDCAGAPEAGQAPGDQAAQA